MNFCSSIFYNSLKMETIQTSINWQMDKTKYDRSFTEHNFCARINDLGKWLRAYDILNPLRPKLTSTSHLPILHPSLYQPDMLKPSCIWGSLSSSLFFLRKERSYTGCIEAESLETQLIITATGHRAVLAKHTVGLVLIPASRLSRFSLVGSSHASLNVCSWHISAREAPSNKVSFFGDLPCKVT